MVRADHPCGVPRWREVAEAQAGAIGWRQLVDLTADRVNARRHVRAHRWQVLVPGVYATFTGPVPRQTWWWALVLHAGTGAALAGEAALWLGGVRDRAPDLVEILVPHGRTVRSPPGAVITSRRGLADLVHPAGSPPRLRVEEAVLDVAHVARRPGPVVDVVLAAVQRRVTTADRLAEALARRHRHRWRALLRDMLAEARAGVHSTLEHRYLVTVERAHGLPRAERNVPRRPDGRGPACYPDLWYPGRGLVIELDGLRAHPRELAFRDRARDNRAVAAGELPLRYGWREVANDPCAVAAELAAVLAARGWTGRPRPCGPACLLAHPRPDSGPAVAGFGDR